MKIDLALTLREQNYYDIDFDFNGDYLMTEGLDTALLMSLFCEKRADSSEVPTPQLQRGWWGNLFNDIPNYEQGSKLWLLYQARLTQNKLNQSITYGDDGVSWFVADNFCERIVTTGAMTVNGITLDFKFFRSQSQVASFSYGLWQGTGISNGN